jgi:hypothetical protein
LVLALILISSPSCKKAGDQSWTEVIISEANNVAFIKAPAERGYNGVRSAQDFLDRESPDISAAIKSLKMAERALAAINLYYIPAIEARGHILNAYREHIAEHTVERDRYLSYAREELDAIMRRGGPELEEATKELSGMLDSIGMHIRLGESINMEFESLIEAFNLHLLKAPLILGAESFREQGG